MSVVNFYWIDLSRFDQKINKSPWIEMAEVLADEGFKVTLLCGYKKEKYVPDGYKIKIRYFKSLQSGGLFKYSLLFHITLWLIKHANSDDILIVRPGSLITGWFVKQIIVSTLLALKEKIHPLTMDKDAEKTAYLRLVEPKWYNN